MENLVCSAVVDIGRFMLDLSYMAGTLFQLSLCRYTAFCMCESLGDFFYLVCSACYTPVFTVPIECTLVCVRVFVRVRTLVCWALQRRVGHLLPVLCVAPFHGEQHRKRVAGGR